MGDRVFALAVLGGGPAALVATLAAARQADVALVMDRLPREDDAPRVDAVPARLLALLVELGLDPRALGVDRLHDHRWVAWETAAPQSRRQPPAAHIDRARLDSTLLSHVLHEPRVTVFVSTRWSRVDEVFWGDGWQARRLIDATGRGAVTADSVVRTARPWAARTFCLDDQPDGSAQPFAIVALPDGYAYRLASSRRTAVGFVGRGPTVQGGPLELESALHATGAGWLVDGLPSLTAFREGRVSTASVQWAASAPTSDPAAPVRIGDAALARDPLSSQGLATAASEALYAVAARNAADLELVRLRQAEQRRQHLGALQTILTTCRFGGERTWRDYAAFVARHTEGPAGRPVAALRGGRLVRL